jgi:hypothetical protein
VWKKHSDWRKAEAKRIRATRKMIKEGFPLESEWNGRKRAEVK